MTKRSKDFMATLEISVISGRSRTKKMFYKADYIKNDVPLKEAVDQFSKFLLQEHHILLEKNDDKRINYLIRCSEEVYGLLMENPWIDQFIGYLGLGEHTFVLWTNGGKKK